MGSTCSLFFQAEDGTRDLIVTGVQTCALPIFATSGVNLHCAVDGDGPLVVLLHGFPECWYSWRHQIAALAPRFRVVAPDLRGYNDSDKPKGVDAYALPELVADVHGLITAFGEHEAVIVGHD